MSEPWATIGRALLASGVKGKFNWEKKTIIWENKTHGPSILNRERKIFHFCCLWRQQPQQHHSFHWCWRVTPPLPSYLRTIVSGGSLEASTIPGPFPSPKFLWWCLFQARQKPCGTCSPSACLHLCSPYSTSSSAVLKSFISKLVDFTWQARGNFEVAVNHMAEFQFSLCF